MQRIITNLGRILEKHRRINKLVDDDDDWDFGGACGYGSPPRSRIVACGYTQEDLDNGC
jgi:hypothetical protein